MVGDRSYERPAFGTTVWVKAVVTSSHWASRVLVEGDPRTAISDSPSLPAVARFLSEQPGLLLKTLRDIPVSKIGVGTDELAALEELVDALEGSAA